MKKLKALEIVKKALKERILTFSEIEKAFSFFNSSEKCLNSEYRKILEGEKNET